MLIMDVFRYPDPRIYWADEVTYDYTLADPIRVDFMRFKPRNTLPSGLEQSEFLAYEVKSCKADFESGHGLNFIGDLNYVVVPPELVGYAREHGPFGVGIYVPVSGYGHGCLCSISCCGFSHDDFSGLGRACRPRNGLNWMVLVSPPERTGKDYDQHAPSTVYPSFAAERGIRRVDRAENTCQRADGA